MVMRSLITVVLVKLFVLSAQTEIAIKSKIHINSRKGDCVSSSKKINQNLMQRKF